ncbi:MAG: chemotaxis protein CheW [Rhodanobacter sp.]|nr:chemotaxis protein CheW [Rhodanobacter sp.]
MADQPHEVRCVMIPVTSGYVLLPNTSVADVLGYMKPDPIPNAPNWLLGRLHWRGWRLPMISFPVLSGRLNEEDRAHARIVVLKALGGNTAMPFFILMAQGFPRLTTITPDLLVPVTDPHPRAAGVRAEVQIRDDYAVIPDLDAIEALVTKALAEREPVKTEIQD